MTRRTTRQTSQSRVNASSKPESKPKEKPRKQASKPEDAAGRMEKETAKQDEDGQDKIKVNRAPVLTLWVAEVAEREGYKFEEELSFGKYIAGLLAISKGRRLGIVKDPEKVEAKKRKRAEAVERFQVFGMSVPGIRTANGLRLAVVNGKPIQPSAVQSYLKRAFGPHYEKVKATMEYLANSYPTKEIGERAYSLYEKFRPNVPPGPKGWGAKGVLDLNLIRDLAKK